jgi:hypothetical protein
MSVAIAKALPTCIFRTQRQVGFALDRKLLLGFTNRLNLSRLRRGFGHMRTFGADWAKSPVSVYNSKTQFFHDAPVAQLDRVHGYEP